MIMKMIMKTMENRIFKLRKGEFLAKTNRLKLAINFIEADIAESVKMIDTEATTGHYGKACGWQKYVEGLEKALSYLDTIQGRGMRDVE